MKRFLCIAAVFLMSASAQAQQVKPSCTDDSRACMIAAAKAYLDAIVTHDASKVPFAPNVRRTEGGRVTGEGEANIRENTKSQPDMAGHANTRYVVDEQTKNVVAFTLLRIPGTKADPNRKTMADRLPPQPSTVHLAERFKVEKGLITEIEAIFFVRNGAMDGASGWPD
jgi:3'(2'), 5'-bisphosphate nucleotidase